MPVPETKKATQVSSSTQLSPELDAKLVECITLIENAKTLDELTKIHHDNPLLQANAIFMKSLSGMKKKILTPAQTVDPLAK
jgi:hypothetical protein